MTDLHLDDLAVFVRVVDRGGFASAARELGTPTSTVSRAIARLESRAGVRLLQRTTRQMSPTSDGRELYGSIAPAVATLRATVQTLEPSSRQVRGRLRVTAPGDLCSGFLADVVVAFAERYPQVLLDFGVSNKPSNLVAEGFDVAVRASAKLDDSSLVARKLGEIEHGLYAAPRYLERHGSPTEPSQLMSQHTVVFRAKELSKTWTLHGPEGSSTWPLRGRIGGDDFTFVRGMVIAGGGIGLLPRFTCVADEASGRLLRVLPDYHARGATLYVLYPSRKHVPPRVTAFRDFVVDAFAAWSSRHAQPAP
ncbi:MAG TPA: LysR family transcriptional regulator [Polyangiaceae bacterium]|nr:LysR family transcriptional regulator [Polyangiaceae bacterium]